MNPAYYLRLGKALLLCSRSLSFVFSLICMYGQVTCQPEVVDTRIRRVENELTGWVQTQKPLKWSLHERMKFYKVQGLSIAVIHNYKIDWAKGYGWADSSEHRPVTTRTLFQAASISKSLNAAGILKLVQDGKVDVYTDINQYLKSWKFPYDSLSKSKKITIANLLSHTAGLTVHGFPGYSRGDSLPSITDILDGKKPSNTAAVRSQFEPGLKFEYSGGGILLSQLIVTDVTHQRYDEYMLQNVLGPLGMSNSFYTQPPPAEKEQVLATAYHSDGTMVKGKFHIYPEQAAAGLWTTPTDLCKFMIETQLAYQGRSHTLLSRELTKLEVTPYLDSSSALGVFIDNRDGIKYFHHSGSNDGFECVYYGTLDGGDGAAVMINSNNAEILDEVVNSVSGVYAWKNFNPVKKTVIEVPDTILSSYVGKYLLNGEPVYITRQKDTLTLNDGKTLYKMYFTSGADFFIYEFRGENKFLCDSLGHVSGFTIGGAVTLKKVE